jgi:penicillin-binding protein 1A
VGFDLKRSMGKGMAGARVALPIWIDFMSVAAYMFPKEDFPVPEGVIFVNCPTPMAFVAGTEEVCSQGREQKKDEVEDIVEPKLLPEQQKTPEQPKIKEVP